VTKQSTNMGRQSPMSGVERPLLRILRCWPVRPDLAISDCDTSRRPAHLDPEESLTTVGYREV
jgi:hypothetical protein